VNDFNSISQQFIATCIYNSGCQICCSGPDSDWVLKSQHTEVHVPCCR